MLSYISKNIGDAMRNEASNNINKTSVFVKHTFYTDVLKPALDLIFAIILLIITSPIFVLIAILIKIDSEGDVIFKQTRVGKNGVEFKIYKFRTMYPHVSNQAKSPTSSNDPRITRVGRFIRKTSLDELPQLINIIKGDMSFIGPRPEQKFIVDNFYTDYEKQRLLVKPGITGLWQISNVRNMPIHEHLEYDFEYIRTLSFINDLKILLRTFIVMFKSNTH